MISKIIVMIKLKKTNEFNQYALKGCIWFYIRHLRLRFWWSTFMNIESNCDNDTTKDDFEVDFEVDF